MWYSRMSLVLFILFLASAASYKPAPSGPGEPSNIPPSTLPPKQHSGSHKTQFSSQSSSSAKASTYSSSSGSSSSSASSFSSSYSSTNGTGGTNCGENEYAVPCMACPPTNCDISYTEYACPGKCLPGCDCITNYLRNNEKKCVFNENCPPPPGSEDSSAVTPEPPKTTSGCQSANTSKSSASATSSSSSSSSSSHSSASSQSSSSSSSHGTGGGGVKCNCTYNRCTPTCSLPSPQNCPQDSNPCNCPPGTIISDKGGKCVQRQECQKYINCKGDYNATYTDCPIACPSTCAKPNAEFCNTKCGKLGCACQYGYLLSKKNGKCIKPEDCPGGYVCGQNEFFMGCSVACPNNYCPTDDSRDIIACDPPHPCLSGCSCKSNHRRKSEKEFICIPAWECPPVKCTRPNEEWNSCPKPCFSDNCSERNRVAKPKDCPYSEPYCDPKCVCKQGFYRNGTEICVTPQECPSDN